MALEVFLLSNEELACAVQNGDTDALAQLWEQTKNFAYAIIMRYKTRPYADEEDYMQCAFLGVQAAAMAYDPSRGSFLTLADWNIRRACRQFYRWYKRGEVQTISYDVPYNPEDPSDGDYKDVFPDDSLPDPWERLERADMIRDVRAAVEELTPRYQAVIGQHYYQGKPLEVIGIMQGVSRERIRQIELKALKQLQRSKHLVSYRREYSPIKGVGLRSFRLYGESAVEHVAITNADRAHRAEQRQLRRDLREFERHVQRSIENGYYSPEIGQIIIDNYKTAHDIA